MAPTVRTHGEVARWIAIQTGFALCCVVPATLGFVLMVCRGDFTMTNSAARFASLALALGIAETVIFTPLVAFRSIGTLRQLNLARDELDRLAHTDPLTGLLNRRGFDKFAPARAGALSPAAALICDLDFFKRVNDDFGHEFGDAALCFVARMLRDEVGARESVIGRLGGEEFAIVLPGMSLTEAREIAERLRSLLASSTVEWRGVSARLTMSVGVAAAAGVDVEIAALLAQADGALYVAKRDGRDRVAAAEGPHRLAA